MVAVRAKDESGMQVSGNETSLGSLILIGEPSSFLSCLAVLLRDEPSVHVCSELHAERALRVALCEPSVVSLL